MQTWMHEIYLLTSPGTKYFQQFTLSGKNTELHLKLLSPEYHYFCRSLATKHEILLLLSKGCHCTLELSGFKQAAANIHGLWFHIMHGLSKSSKSQYQQKLLKLLLHKWEGKTCLFLCKRETFWLYKMPRPRPRLQSVLNASARCLDSTLSHTKKLFFIVTKLKLEISPFWFFWLSLLFATVIKLIKGGKFLKN